MEDDDILDLVPAGILRDFRDTVKIKIFINSTSHWLPAMFSQQLHSR